MILDVHVGTGTVATLYRERDEFVWDANLCVGKRQGGCKEVVKRSLKATYHHRAPNVVQNAKFACSPNSALKNWPALGDPRRNPHSYFTLDPADCPYSNLDAIWKALLRFKLVNH